MWGEMHCFWWNYHKYVRFQILGSKHNFLWAWGVFFLIFRNLLPMLKCCYVRKFKILYFSEKLLQKKIPHITKIFSCGWVLIFWETFLLKILSRAKRPTLLNEYKRMRPITLNIPIRDQAKARFFCEYCFYIILWMFINRSFEHFRIKRNVEKLSS